MRERERENEQWTIMTLFQTLSLNQNIKIQQTRGPETSFSQKAVVFRLLVVVATYSRCLT